MANRTYKKSDGQYVTEVTVVQQERYDQGPFLFEGTLSELVENISGIVDMVPEEFRETASYEFSSEGGYEGSHYATVEVGYNRPAIQEEINVYEQNVEIRSEMQRMRELQTLAALKAKYGS